MLKTTKSFDKPASGKNDNNRPVPGQNNGNGEVDRFGVGGDGMKYTQKSGKLKKLSKSGESKSEKVAKSKNLLKSRNSPNIYAKEAGPSFPTFDAKATFNSLRLVFLIVLIF